MMFFLLRPLYFSTLSIFPSLCIYLSSLYLCIYLFSFSLSLYLAINSFFLAFYVPLLVRLYLSLIMSFFLSSFLVSPSLLLSLPLFLASSSYTHSIFFLSVYLLLLYLSTLCFSPVYSFLPSPLCQSFSTFMTCI